MHISKDISRAGGKLMRDKGCLRHTAGFALGPQGLNVQSLVCGLSLQLVCSLPTRCTLPWPIVVRNVITWHLTVFVFCVLEFPMNGIIQLALFLSFISFISMLLQIPEVHSLSHSCSVFHCGKPRLRILSVLGYYE